MFLNDRISFSWILRMFNKIWRITSFSSIKITLLFLLIWDKPKKKKSKIFLLIPKGVPYNRMVRNKQSKSIRTSNFIKNINKLYLILLFVTSLNDWPLRVVLSLLSRKTYLKFRRIMVFHHLTSFSIPCNPLYKLEARKHFPQIDNRISHNHLSNI